MTKRLQGENNKKEGLKGRNLQIKIDQCVDFFPYHFRVGKERERTVIFGIIGLFLYFGGSGIMFL